MRKTELLAPGGSFDSALAALENGADAVYCGLQSFSARKAAKNLDTDQLSRLKKFAAVREKKVYLTLNTILKQEELAGVIDVLFLARDLSIDGIIVQDPGLIKIVRDHFPQLELHGSTQMAVHNSEGLRALKDAGFSRVVLPRELTILEIETLHRRHPEIELEVFIHGAQCYGFSGICLASGLLLGRSGNRGDCGQICRTWFHHSGRQGYYFSCNDLYSGTDALKLAEAGVASLKIEGRMKSPAYAAAVSRLYRQILNGKDPEEIPALEEEARTAFSREPVKGHLFNKKGENMINPDYSGHLGIPAGVVENRKNGMITLAPHCKLSPRDGLMFFKQNGKPVHFALRPAGKKGPFRPGHISIYAPEPQPPAGTLLYKVQSHNHHWKEAKPESFSRYLLPVKTTISLTPSELTVEIPQWDFRDTFSIEAEEAKNAPVLREKIANEMERSADYSFCLTPVFFSEASQSEQPLFLPPSRIKKIRQELYRRFDEHRRQYLFQKRKMIIEKLDKEWTFFLEKHPSSLPSRDSWAPQGTPLPYLTEAGLNRKDIVLRNGEAGMFLPLAPLQFPAEEQKFAEALASLPQPEEQEKVYGLNNWGHIGLFRHAPSLNSSVCVLDAGLLTANTAGVLLFDELLSGRVQGCYGWVELAPEELPDGFSDAGNTTALPLFISRNCFKKHSLNHTCKSCRQSDIFHLTQNGKPYTVIVEDCISWVFQGKIDSAKDSESV